MTTLSAADVRADFGERLTGRSVDGTADLEPAGAIEAVAETEA